MSCAKILKFFHTLNERALMSDEISFKLKIGACSLKMNIYHWNKDLGLCPFKKIKAQLKQ